jgi:protein TonB
MSLGATLPGAAPFAGRAAVRPVWLRPLALGVILALHAALFFTFKGERAILAPLDTVDVTLAPLGDSAMDRQQVEESRPAPPPPSLPPPPAPADETPPELAAQPPKVVTPEAAPLPEAPREAAKPKLAAAPKLAAPKPPELRQEKIAREKIREREQEQKEAVARREKLREAAEGRRNEKEQEARQQARRGVADGSRSGGMSSASYAALLAGELRRRTFYPAAARAVGATGTVGVVFTVGPSGRVVSQSITRSSGNAALDAAAHAIMSGVHTPPPPGGRYSTSTNLRFNFH